MATKKRTSPTRFPFLSKVLCTLRKCKTNVVRKFKKFVNGSAIVLKETVSNVRKRWKLVSERTYFCYLKSGQKVRRFVKIAKQGYTKAIFFRPVQLICEECVICLTVVKEEDTVRDMCHGRLLHHECIQTAITNGIRSCPLCRCAIPRKVVQHKFRELLKHTSTCCQHRCDVQDCDQLKRILEHSKECKFARGCHLCKKLATQLYYHHVDCNDLFCKVPMCFFPWKR